MSMSIAAALLAGGESRRMQYRDKGLLQYRQQALVAHVLQRLQAQIDTLVIVANRHLDSYRQFGVPVISDWDDEIPNPLQPHPPFHGPMRGIYRALRYYQLQTDAPQWILLAPCDAPNYPTDLLSRYQAALPRSAPGTQCFIPHDGIRLQPLFSLIHQSCFDSIDSALKKHAYSLNRWLQEISYHAIDMPAKYFQNINHPEQLEESDP